MKNPLYIIVLLSISFISYADNQDVPCSEKQYPINDGYRFKTILSNGLIVENIAFYKPTPSSDYWHLSFRTYKNLKIQRPVHNKLVAVESISVDEYLELLEITLDNIRSKNIDVKISSIQMDLTLVDDTWLNVVDAVKEEARHKKGVIHIKDRSVLKDRDIIRAVSAGLQRSPQVTKACDLLKNYGLACQDDKVGMKEYVAYKKSVFGKNWSSLIDDKDAGLYAGKFYTYDDKRLNNAQWFGIKINN